MTLGQFAGIDNFALSKKNQLIEHGDNVAARLVDGEDNSAVVVTSEGDKALHNIVGVVGVQA